VEHEHYTGAVTPRGLMLAEIGSPGFTSQMGSALAKAESPWLARSLQECNSQAQVFNPGKGRITNAR